MIWFCKHIWTVISQREVDHYMFGDKFKTTTEYTQQCTVCGKLKKRVI